VLQLDAIAADIGRMSRRARTTLAAAACLLACAVVVAPALSATSRAHVRLGALEAGLLNKLNRIRVGHGLRPLRLNGELTDAATAHSVEMGSDGYFEHDSFDGTPFWKRIGRFYSSSGRGYWSVGENLLWSSDDLDPDAAFAEWMNSPPHRENILEPRWREVGVAVARFASAGGVYDGRSVMIITTDFGVRR
jgi:uncharacterized protein YkwD